jgi:predicted amidohydrolase YtcJ
MLRADQRFAAIAHARHEVVDRQFERVAYSQTPTGAKLRQGSVIENLKSYVNWEREFKAGATIAGASDWPVSSPNPWNAIAQASTRTGPLGVLNAAESIDRETMLRAYTINAAKALRQEDRIGSLAPGKQADLILLDRDIFTVSDAELFDTKVLQTWFAGKPVHQAGATTAHAQ